MKRVIEKTKIYSGKVKVIDNDNLQSRIFRILLVLLGALALCYFLISVKMVFNIVARQDLGIQVKNLTKEVSDLELKYFSLSSKLDIASSKEMGFQETRAQFATRKSLTALEFPTNEL
jgi:hypothetical protein